MQLIDVCWLGSGAASKRPAVWRGRRGQGGDGESRGVRGSRSAHRGSGDHLHLGNHLPHKVVSGVLERVPTCKHLGAEGAVQPAQGVQQGRQGPQHGEAAAGERAHVADVGNPCDNGGTDLVVVAELPSAVHGVPHEHRRDACLLSVASDARGGVPGQNHAVPHYAMQRGPSELGGFLHVAQKPAVQVQDRSGAQPTQQPAKPRDLRGHQADGLLLHPAVQHHGGAGLRHSVAAGVHGKQLGVLAQHPQRLRGFPIGGGAGGRRGGRVGPEPIAQAGDRLHGEVAGHGLAAGHSERSGSRGGLALCGVAARVAALGDHYGPLALLPVLPRGGSDPAAGEPPIAHLRGGQGAALAGLFIDNRAVHPDEWRGLADGAPHGSGGGEAVVGDVLQFRRGLLLFGLVAKQPQHGVWDVRHEQRQQRHDLL
eukprot:RCo015989